MRALAAAATIALAIGLPLYVLRSGRPPASVPDSGTRGTDVKPELVLLEPVKTIAVVPARLRWEKLAGAETYRVRIYAQDGLPLWTSTDVPEANVAWPSSLTLVPGKYFCQVTAFRSGEVLAESSLTSFQLQP